jgi:NH3-dependent NAD+ synthetase
MKKKHLQVIERIQNSIPKELKDSLMKEERYAPVTLEIIDKALADKRGTPEFLEKLQALKDSGELDRTMQVVDVEVEKKIDAYMESELKKAIKRGELPKKMEKLKTKSKQHVRRSQKDTISNSGKPEHAVQDNGGLPETSGK